MGSFYKLKTGKELAENFIKEENLELGLLKFRAGEVWTKVCGELVGSMTESVYFVNKSIVVKMKSSALANELMMRRSEILEGMNKEYGKNIVKGIIIK